MNQFGQSEEADPAEQLEHVRSQIARDGGSVELYHALGCQLAAGARHQEAIQAFDQALAWEPRAASVLIAKGLAWAAEENFAQALAVFTDVVRYHPQLGVGHLNKGNAEFAHRQFDAAVVSYRRALEDPSLQDRVGCLNNLGTALAASCHWDDAIAAFREAVAAEGHSVVSRINLGRALLCRRDLQEAVEVCHEVIQLDPQRVEGFALLGQCWQLVGMPAAASECFGRALALQPEAVDLRIQLGNAQSAAGQLTAAAETYQQVLAALPDYAEVHSNLGEVHRLAGQLSLAMQAQRQALRINPQLHETHSNLLLTWQYRSDVTQAELSAAARAWAAAHARPAQSRAAFSPSLDPQRRLRLGYVSANLSGHPVGHYLEPLLARHNREHFEVHVFASQPRGDVSREKMIPHTEHWHPAGDWSDDELAERIRAAQIDLLIDLSGHTVDNRLRVFAARAAPVQVSWAGYVHTTGLQTMDYLLGDDVITPADDQPWFTETIVRLPRPYLCFVEPAEAVAVKQAISKSPSPFTLGCFHRLDKINHRVIQAWSAILRGVPAAVLLLQTKALEDAAVRRRYVEEFGRCGVAASQLRLEGQAPPEAAWEAYRQVDLTLDPFPVSGGSSILESLWMGVPVLTCRGQRLAARLGASYLACLNLPELIAADHQEYVDRAITMARTRCLPAVGESLRARLLASPLGDWDGFTKDFESALRGMWQNYCASP